MTQKFTSLFLAFFLLGIVTIAHCESNVVSLTESNFKDKVSQGVWLVEYFAPWCGHCKNLAPIWEELATEVKGDINVGNVDCTVQKGLCSKFGVKGYPTIKLLREGKYYDYTSARNVASFTSFAKEGYKTSEAKDLPVEVGTKTEKTEEVVKAESQVVHLSEQDFYSTVAQGSWIVKYYAPWCGHCKNLAPAWDELSTKTDGKFKVAKVDCTVHRSVCSDFGIRGYPTIKLVKDGKAYDYSGARTIEAFTAFATGGYSSAPSKDLPAVAKSDDTDEEKRSSKEVIVLTQENFDTKIASGDWLVEFYAPWCGHCKSLAPIWDDLATKADVNVAKVDCTVEKDLMTRFGVRGFPTIKFIKDGVVYDYKGSRTVEAFMTFSKTGYKEAPSAPLKVQKDEL